jgi:phosphonate transport system permease protein
MSNKAGKGDRMPKRELPGILLTAGNHIRIRKVTRDSVLVTIITLSLLLLALAGFFMIDTKGVDIGAATVEALGNLYKMLVKPQIDPESLKDLTGELLLTLGLSVLSTLTGAFIALILGLLGARNLAGDKSSRLVRGFVALIRAVPTELWVLIFAIGAGLGSTAAIIGMTFHSAGYLIKAYSEAFEEIDPGVIEALKASGANWFQIVFQAVLPSSLSWLISWTFVRFEINFTVAVTVGAAAGAGGIGFDLFMASSFYYNIYRVGTITWLVLIVALLLEFLANRIKKKLIVQN